MFWLWLIKFGVQLDNYIDDTRHEDIFIGLTNLVDLSVLVQIGRHKVYDMVYNLLKLVLLLLVAIFFFQSQLFTSTDPKALSSTFTGFWAYKLATYHWLYRYRFVFFFLRHSLLPLATTSSAPLTSPPTSAPQALSGGYVALLWWAHVPTLIVVEAPRPPHAAPLPREGRVGMVVNYMWVPLTVFSKITAA